jgi:hypothetical protein
MSLKLPFLTIPCGVRGETNSNENVRSRYNLISKKEISMDERGGIEGGSKVDTGQVPYVVRKSYMSIEKIILKVKCR